MITKYFGNTGGIDITRSPIYLKDNQATGASFNYDYSKTGSITKVLAPALLNAVADSQTNCLGLGFHHDVQTDNRTLVRMAGVNFQTMDTTTGTISTLADDTISANTSFLSSTSTQQVVSSAFNTSNEAAGTQLWMAGGGMSGIYGYLGPTSNQVTQNGVQEPAGSLTATVNTSAGGAWPSGDTGEWYYGLQFRKRSTQSFSNVSLDVSGTIVNLTDTITLNWSLTNLDTTLYDKIYVWRSPLNGVSGFTVGSIIAELSSTVATYIDTGTSLLDSQNVARAGNIVLDNSPLPSGQTYNYVTVFKRRLVAFSGSNIYISDLNKPESWPLTNYITITTGGSITGGMAIGNPSEYTTGLDEYLCIWKERELWSLVGNSSDDWVLAFVDKTGCASQSLATAFNGWVAWMGYTGIFIWGGNGQPIRLSRPIQSLWDTDGDINKPFLKQGVCAQYEKASQVIWRVSDRTIGFNQLSIKLDTRLTAENIANALNLLDIDGVFLLDKDSNSYTAMVSLRPSNYDEMLIVGDNAGHVYQMFQSSSTAVLFDYETKPLDQGYPERIKRYKRVLVYLEKLTDNDLSLYYWTDYRVRAEYQSVTKATMQPTKGTQPALFDIALFDQAYFDDYTPDISVIEFNLHNDENNAEGLSLKLKFEQYEASAPVRIHGFAIDWDDMSDLPIPTSQVG